MAFGRNNMKVIAIAILGLAMWGCRGDNGPVSEGVQQRSITNRRIDLENRFKAAIMNLNDSGKEDLSVAALRIRERDDRFEIYLRLNLRSRGIIRYEMVRVGVDTGNRKLDVPFSCSSQSTKKLQTAEISFELGKGEATDTVFNYSGVVSEWFGSCATNSSQFVNFIDLGFVLGRHPNDRNHHPQVNRARRSDTSGRH